MAAHQGDCPRHAALGGREGGMKDGREGRRDEEMEGGKEG